RPRTRCRPGVVRRASTGRGRFQHHLPRVRFARYPAAPAGRPAGVSHWRREGMSHPSAHKPASAEKSAAKDFRGLPDHEKYDRSSAENPEFWYDPEMGLQRLERLRFPYFAERLGPFAGKRVLDVGCGGGILAEDLARAGARVVGVD